MHDMFARGGICFGLNQSGDFVFRSWHDVWCAVQTTGNPLQRWSKEILARRKFAPQLSNLERIRISLDANPPVVEVIYAQTVGWVGSAIVGLALWVLAIKLFV